MAEIKMTTGPRTEEVPPETTEQVEETVDDSPPEGTNYLDVTEVPSGFLAYPENAHIYYRGFKNREIVEFNESRLTASDSMEFIMRGIYTKGMPKRDITLGDFLYVAFLRRISSLGDSTFEVTIMPRELKGETVTAEFSFENDIKFDELEVPKLPLVVSIDGNIMHFSPLTVGRYLDLFDKRTTTDPADKNWTPSKFEFQAAQCTNLEFEDALKIIEDAVGRDISVLDEVDDLLDHSVMPVEVKYTVGEGENKEEKSEAVDVDNPISFVLPFRKESRESIRDSIQFGV